MWRMFGCAEQQRDPAAVNQEIIENLIKAGFPETDIMVVDDIVYVGRDVEVSLAASREMLEIDESISDEQYRTTNLVSTNLDVICVNGSTFTGKFSTALNRAIVNYNNLNLTFSMQRTSGSTSGCDAVIPARIVGGTGGSAGFPSGGLPFNRINIGSGLNSFSTDTIEHVITHELGH